MVGLNPSNSPLWVRQCYKLHCIANYNYYESKYMRVTIK